jgi:hypothetical protein
MHQNMIFEMRTGPLSLSSCCHMAKVETKVLRVAAVLASGGGCWCFSLFVTDEGHVVVAES